MSKNLCVFCCDSFHAEVAAVIALEQWPDVTSAAFPVRCGRPSIRWEELKTLIPPECEQIIVLGRACLSGLTNPPPDFPRLLIVVVEQCFHLVAGQKIVNEAISNGAYLITPSWLKNWQQQIEKMGFTLPQAREFFQDVAKEILFLDTGLDADAKLHLAELVETLALPVRSLTVGLDYTRLFLSGLVLEWRLTQAQTVAKERQRQYSSELANYVCAMDMLAKLARSGQETEVIAQIKELFQMLFAPQAVYYVRVENNIPVSVEASIPPALRESLIHLKTQYAITAEQNGFLLRIGREEETLALLAVERLTFPEYRERYLNMALALIDVCGLAIENARNRQKLLEAEKMASLAVLVAGVAHEINTPLGVGLTAATSLEQQSHQLAQSFTERRMTQSELKNYLEQTQTSTALLHQNLARIGHLIDTFRQVAVHNKPVEKQTFRLKTCVEDVIHSLGDRLSNNKITVTVQCEPTLEINSVLDDWVSIFVNLIVNSLKHGFKNQPQGAIQIVINSDVKKIYLDYRDDGTGLTPENLARIFDPFFTTDLQHGMGLGMHLVYNQITHRLGGSIQCDSTPKQGVHFHIEVPR